MGALQEKRAQQILEFCKKKKRIFFTTRYGVGKIVDPETNRPYRAHELGASVKILSSKGLFIKISKSRWQIQSYDLNK